MNEPYTRVLFNFSSFSYSYFNLHKISRFPIFHDADLEDRGSSLLSSTRDFHGKF